MEDVFPSARVAGPPQEQAALVTQNNQGGSLGGEVAEPGSPVVTGVRRAAEPGTEIVQGCAVRRAGAFG